MKTLRIALLAIVVLPFMSSCGKFSDKRFSTTIPLVFEISKADSNTTVLDMEQTLTALINANLNEVKDKIKSYELKSITYKIWEYYGSNNPVNLIGSVGFGNVNMSNPGVTYEFNDISLEAGNSNADQVPVSLNSQDIERIQQYFLDTDGLRLWIDGNVSEVPVHFKIAFTVSVDAIAEVKD